VCEIAECDCVRLEAICWFRRDGKPWDHSVPVVPYNMQLTDTEGLIGGGPFTCCARYHIRRRSGCTSVKRSNNLVQRYSTVLDRTRPHSTALDRMKAPWS